MDLFGLDSYPMLYSDRNINQILNDGVRKFRTNLNEKL